ESQEEEKEEEEIGGHEVIGDGIVRVVAYAKAADIDGLIRELQSPDEAVRCSAARHLGQFHAHKAKGPLIELTKSDPAEDVSPLAVRALGSIGGQEVVDPLITALK